MAKPFSVVVFHCRHMFHKECLPSSGTVSSFPIVYVTLHTTHHIISLVWCWIRSSYHIFFHELLYFISKNLNITFCPILRLLYVFPLSHFRFLWCSSVTSAVRRSAAQEVESWRWKSSRDVCTHNVIIDAFIFSLVAFPLLSMHWSINITFPQSVDCTLAKMLNSYIGLSLYIYIQQLERSVLVLLATNVILWWNVCKKVWKIKSHKNCLWFVSENYACILCNPLEYKSV